jgi:hypothetical protein
MRQEMQAEYLTTSELEIQWKLETAVKSRRLDPNPVVQHS